MGTGHSIDTPIRVAPYGISSVVSLVDDILLEKVRQFYCNEFSMPFDRISGSGPEKRSLRITAYLDTLWDIVQLRMDELRGESVFDSGEKRKYFDLLPDDSPLKKDYFKLLSMQTGRIRERFESEISERMKPGSIDVNIMVKVDRLNPFKNKGDFGEALSDAKSALKGFAESKVESAVIFSAGLNQSLYSYTSKFGDFYRNELGDLKKKIILKVSDYRSAVIQGKFLAKKGLEVSEFRIESGLNCGGHAFAAGSLLPNILDKFREKKDQIASEFMSNVEKYYNKLGRKFPETAKRDRPLITVQGGIGTNGEVRRLMEHFKLDATGWATPFLLVPEATCVDGPTVDLLKSARKTDLYLSDVSPLGVPFNNVRNSGSELWTKQRIKEGKPGSPCPKGFLRLNREFGDEDLCPASRKYQEKKLQKIEEMDIPRRDKKRLKDEILEKTCICDHLGNGALIQLGLSKKAAVPPQSVCPGPNIEWFDRTYSLQEMVDHIYGRGKSLVPEDRPHMFAKEIELYVDYFKKRVSETNFSEKLMESLSEIKRNIEEGMDYCLEMARSKPFPNENLKSIPEVVDSQRERLGNFFKDFETNFRKWREANLGPKS